jgi:hypothetical protein
MGIPSNTPLGTATTTTLRCAHLEQPIIVATKMFAPQLQLPRQRDVVANLGTSVVRAANDVSKVIALLAHFPITGVAIVAGKLKI